MRLALICWLLRSARMTAGAAISRALGSYNRVLALFEVWPFAAAGLWISRGAHGRRIVADTSRG